MRIEEVKNVRDLEDFIQFQYDHYKKNSCFVPLLKFDVRNTLRSDKNPAFKFCKVKMFTVKSDTGAVLGRIVGIINSKEIEIWKKSIGRFGWIEFVDNRDVSKMLFETYEDWLRENNIEYSHGPMGFTDLDQEGMLIEGFNELGTLPMIYNYEYYPKHLENLGYAKDVDWVEYEIKVPREIPEKIERVNRIVMEKLDLHVFKAKKARDLKKYAKNIFLIQNEAYANLYGYVPLNEEQMEVYTEQYFGFINPDFVKLVMDKNESPVGFGIAMPSLSKALQKANGSLFPFGFLHLLYALRFPKTIDLYITGVKKEYHDLGVNALLISEIAKSCIKRKIFSAETSGELETNVKIQSFWKYFERRQHKRRRCYVKKL
ncbi:MAG: hypothetical protein PHW02_05315 [bacterium]|nr:hypothetical protein [bacterium]